MKRFFTILVLLLGLSYLSATAQDEVMWIDYCGGKKAASGQKINTTGTIELAIKFTQEDLAGYAGNEIRHIAIGWPSGNPGGDITVWVRTIASGSNICQQTVKAASGWQDVALDTPYAIDGKKDLFIGVTFTQSSTRTGYVSLAGTTDEDGCYYRIGETGEWQSYASLNKGSLAIRMGIWGDNLPTHDLSISKVAVARNIYPVGTEIPVTGTLTNKASDAAVNPIVRASINGNVIKDFTIDGTLNFTQTQNFSFSIPTESITDPCEANIQLEALWADGIADTQPDDNVATATVNLVTPVHDLSIVKAAAGTTAYKVGSPIVVYGSIKNNNYVIAKNPKINGYINGELMSTATVDATLDYGETADYSFQVPTTSITDDATVNVDVELVWADGSEDDTPADNKKTVSNVQLSKDLVVKKMVVEEGTGTWCGWCIRGLVGLKQMKQQYPDRFIGIAVHVSDSFQEDTYANWITGDGGIGGFPSCLINRDGTVYDPNYSKLNSMMKAQLNTVPDAEVTAVAGISGNKVVMKATVVPTSDLTSRKLCVLFAVTEDALKSTQSNYYSGGGSGEMGGFENEGSSVVVSLNDVARGIWPSAAYSATTKLPTSMTKGEAYTVDYEIATSSLTYKNASNLCITAILLDGATGKILNGDQQAFSAVDGIDTVLAPATTDAPAYNLAGQRVSENAKGIVIENGKKIIR